jgi:hypothetical protein
MDEDIGGGRGSSKRSTRSGGSAENEDENGEADDSNVSTTGTMRRVGNSQAGDKSGSAGSNSSFLSSWVNADMSSSDLDDGGIVRTTREKQKLLGKYLNNVEDLVQDLRESGLFENAVA